MKNQESCLDVKKFLEWREQLTDALNYRRETVIELLDALSSNQQAADLSRIVSQFFI